MVAVSRGEGMLVEEEKRQHRKDSIDLRGHKTTNGFSQNMTWLPQTTCSVLTTHSWCRVSPLSQAVLQWEGPRRVLVRVVFPVPGAQRPDQRQNRAPSITPATLHSGSPSSERFQQLHYLNELRFHALVKPHVWLGTTLNVSPNTAMNSCLIQGWAPWHYWSPWFSWPCGVAEAEDGQKKGRQGIWLAT